VPQQALHNTWHAAASVIRGAHAFNTRSKQSSYTFPACMSGLHAELARSACNMSDLTMCDLCLERLRKPSRTFHRQP